MRPIALLLLLALFTLPGLALAVEPGKGCKKDADCKVADSCLGCGQCFSTPPVGPRGTDCKAECYVPPGTGCACVEGQCQVAKPKKIDSPRYLRATDGRQCELSGANSKALEPEKSRLKAAGIAVEEIQVSTIVRADSMGAGCVPADVEAFWSAHPEAAAGLKKALGMVCEACGCPEAWYYCVASRSGARAMREAGFAPVK